MFSPTSTSTIIFWFSSGYTCYFEFHVYLISVWTSLENNYICTLLAYRTVLNNLSVIFSKTELVLVVATLIIGMVGELLLLTIGVEPVKLLVLTTDSVLLPSLLIFNFTFLLLDSSCSLWVIHDVASSLGKFRTIIFPDGLITLRLISSGELRWHFSFISSLGWK